MIATMVLMKIKRAVPMRSQSKQLVSLPPNKSQSKRLACLPPKKILMQAVSKSAMS
jgi:hypothetical protein